MRETSNESQEDEVRFSIFNYDKSMFSEYIKKCIQYCFEDDEQIINIPKLIEHLGFTIHLAPIKDKAVIEHKMDDTLAKLTINESMDNKEKNAIAVLIVAEYLLRFERTKSKRIVFDDFYLNDIKQARMSKHTFLATRLAIPEKIIEQLDQFDNDKTGYSDLAQLPVHFLDLAKKKQSAEVYLKMSDGNAADWLMGW